MRIYPYRNSVDSVSQLAVPERWVPVLHPGAAVRHTTHPRVCAAGSSSADAALQGAKDEGRDRSELADGRH